MIKIARLLIFLWVILLMITLVGCWDNKDLSERSFIVATGFDKAADGKILLTVQIAKPSPRVGGGGSGGGGGGSGGGGKESEFWTNTVEGSTISEAVRNQLTTLNRKNYYYHQQLIVIGEEIARQGINDILDFFERSPEGQWRGRVVVCKGISPKKVLEAKSNLEKLPTIHIDETLRENSIYLGTVRKVIIFDLLKSIGSGDENLVIGTIEGDPTKQDLMIDNIKVQGTAIFNKDSLLGFLSPDETRAFLFAKNELKGCVLNIPNPLDSGKLVAIEIGHSDTEIKVKFKEGKPIFELKITTEGNIWNKQGVGYLASAETLEKLKSEVSAEVQSQVKGIISLAQNKFKTDIFGFEKLVHRKYPQYWAKVSKQWNEEFRNAEVEINVKTKIKRGGLIIDERNINELF